MEFLSQEQIEEITDLAKEQINKSFENMENIRIEQCCKSIYYKMMARYYRGF